MMKLYSSNSSPYGRKVRIVLAEKGLRYEQDTTGAQVRSVEELATLNPGLKIPILQDGDLTLFDSELIVDYLFKTYPTPPDIAPPPPLAQSPRRREHMWEDAKLLVTVETLLESATNLRQLANSGIDPETSSYLQRHQTRIEYCLDWLDERATPEGFIPGHFTMADIGLICALDFGTWREVFEWRGRPGLEALTSYFRFRPSVRSTYPE